jgi:hypothetical protein
LVKEISFEKEQTLLFAMGWTTAIRYSADEVCSSSRSHGLSPLRAGKCPRAVHAEFVIDKVVVEQIFL